MLLQSGRDGFELLQKAVMAGFSVVAAVGTPSSLGDQLARQIDIALWNFLRDTRFNFCDGIEHKSDLWNLPSAKKAV